MEDHGSHSEIPKAEAIEPQLQTPKQRDDSRKNPHVRVYEFLVSNLKEFDLVGLKYRVHK